MRKEVVYIAKDGTHHATQDACEMHEKFGEASVRQSEPAPEVRTPKGRVIDVLVEDEHHIPED